MKIVVPDYYKKFKCIASKCEDTCCAGWEIVIDDDSYKYYKSVSGKFGDRLKKEIILDEDGDNIFTLKGNNCCFLNKDKMCDIYIELGKESLCNTCKQYPRFTEEYGSTREMGISLSCPEAARIILNTSEKVEFELEENDEIVSTYNDISYEMFVQLLNSRKICLNILQDRSIDLNKRMGIILNFAQEIQEKVDENKISEIGHVRKKYSDDAFIKDIINDFEKYKGNKNIKYNNVLKCFKAYQEIEHINDNWIEVLENVIKHFYEMNSDVDYYVDKHKEFNEYYVDNIYEYEQLIVYFIFRYFMKAVYDYDIIARVKLSILSYLIIKELNIVAWCENGFKFTENNQVDIIHMYSKDVEHSENNLENLAEIFEINKIFNLENFMIMLMN